MEYGRAVVLLQSLFELGPGILSSQESAGEPGSDSQLGCSSVRPVLSYKPWF